MHNLRETGSIAAASLLAVAVLTFVAPTDPAVTTVALSESHRVAVGKVELHVDAWVPAVSPVDADKEIIKEYLSAKYPTRSKRNVEVIVEASYKEAAKRGLNPLLVIAMIEKESSLKHRVKNSYGAQGLMQVVPRWHPEKMKAILHPDGLLDPETNIAVGTTILAEYLERTSGNLDKALKRYSGDARNYYKIVKSFKSDMKRALTTGNTNPEKRFKVPNKEA